MRNDLLAKRRGNNHGSAAAIAARAVRRNPNFLGGSVSTPEPRVNPDNEDTPLQAGVTCRGCHHFVLDASDEDAHKHQGWWFCGDCYYDLPEVREGLIDMAVRADRE